MKHLTRIALTFLVAAVLGLGVNTPVQAADDGEKAHQGHAMKAAETPQKTCPVMGGKINKELYTDVEGKRVYVCCKGCIAKIEANPEKYLAVLEKRGEEVADAPKASCKACESGECKSGECKHKGMHAKHAMQEQRADLEPQKTCPIMGGKINKDLYVETHGRKVYVCCKGCLSKVKANPEQAIQTLHKRGEKAEMVHHPTVSTRTLAVLHQAQVPMTLVDARGRVDKMIPGAIHVPSRAEEGTIEAALPEKDALIVAYCASLQCPAGAKLAARLREMGYANVLEYPYGIKGWTEADLPVTTAGD
jgi:rhodanese-related sulfurtransferase/YHS domain-containing protein